MGFGRGPRVAAPHQRDAERNVGTLCQELIRLGHSVVVITLQPGALPDEEVINGVRVIRIHSWSQKLTSLYTDASLPFHPPAPDPGVVAALRRVLARERPDVVHSNGWLGYSYFPLHGARRGPAHVMTLHDYGLVCARKTLMHAPTGEHCSGPRLAKCLACAPATYGVARGSAITTGLRASRMMFGRADRYVAITSAVAEGTRAGVPPRRDLVVIPAMVPNHLPALAQATPRPAFLESVPDGYLMFVGALGPHKGVDVLLEAHRRMRHRLPLVLVGTPRPDTPPIEGEDIVVAHNVPSAQGMSAWMRSSVAVVPSVWAEPLGLVAVEAMLVGRPVVASDVGGLRDVVQHGFNGLMVPPADVDALASALDTLIENPGLRQQLGQAGRESARKFEAASVAPRIVEVYEDAVKSRG